MTEKKPVDAPKSKRQRKGRSEGKSKGQGKTKSRRKNLGEFAGSEKRAKGSTTKRPARKSKGEAESAASPQAQSTPRRPTNIDSRLRDELDRATSEDTIEAVVMIRQDAPRVAGPASKATTGEESPGTKPDETEKRNPTKVRSIGAREGSPPPAAEGESSERAEGAVPSESEQEEYDRDLVARIAEETGEEPIEVQYMPRLGAVYLKARKRLVERLIEEDDVSSATSVNVDIELL